MIPLRDDPNAIAGRLWFKTAFPDHPYGPSSKGNLETVKAITIDDLRTFLAKALAKDRLSIGIVGDISAQEVGPLLTKKIDVFCLISVMWSFLAVQSSSFCHELNMTKADHFCSVPIEQKLSLAFWLNGLPITQGWRI